MTDDVKVSVVLPVYNGEAYLEECLKSIIDQTLRDIEIICVDDGSKDGSFEIMNTFMASDSRIKVFKQENSGAGVARNFGLKHATGKYLSFLDADDFFEPDMLEKAYVKMEETNSDVLIFGGNRYDDTKKEYIQMEYSVKKDKLPSNNPFVYSDVSDYIFTFSVGWAWDKIFRRELILEKGIEFQNLRTSNDLFFVFVALVSAERIYVLDDILTHHRTNLKGSLSATRERSWNCFYTAMKALKEKLKNEGIYKEVERGFLNWAIHFCFWNLNTIDEKGFENVYYLIQNECTDEFGFLEHERNYYDEKESYDRLVEMQEFSCEEYKRNRKKSRSKTETPPTPKKSDAQKTLVHAKDEKKPGFFRKLFNKKH
jgi:Glycosyltransferases involved in cell wall biogenesis